MFIEEICHELSTKLFRVLHTNNDESGGNIPIHERCSRINEILDVELSLHGDLLATEEQRGFFKHLKRVLSQPFSETLATGGCSRR